MFDETDFPHDDLTVDSLLDDTLFSFIPGNPTPERIERATVLANRYAYEVVKRYGLVEDRYVAELFYEGLEVSDPLILSRLPGAEEVYDEDIYIPTFVATVRAIVLETVKQTLGKDTI